MPKSMTGFGSGECTRYSRKIKVEIRATNKRDNSADISIRMPSVLDPFENNIRRRLLTDITRGIIHATIHVENFAVEEFKLEINYALADAFVEGLKSLNERYSFGELDSQKAMEILAGRSDIFKLSSKQSSPTNENELWETLQAALDEAIAALNKSRMAEGMATVEDIRTKVSSLAALISSIEKRLPDVEKEQSEKILERISQIADRFNEEPDIAILVSEVGSFVNRRCINEEIVRTKSHLQQITDRLNQSGAIGRELEFTVKELKRETHTISAKAIDVFITSAIIEAKVLTEKIYEQVLNIE